MEIGKARSYSSEERRRAVEEAIQLGPSVASKKLGIPAGTLSCWVFLTKQRAAQEGGVVKSLQPAGSSERARPQEVATGVSRSPAASGVGAAPEAAPSEPAAGTAPSSPEPRAHVAKVYTPSQRAQILEYAAKHGPTAAAKQFGASRFSIREWTRKTAAAAAGGMTPGPTTGPDTSPADERERRVLKEWRAHPGLGPSQVRNQLRRAGYKVSVHSCRVVMEQHGYVTPMIRRESADDNRYEATRPNALWHLDFLHRYVHKQPVYVLLLVDDYSRFITGAALWDGERSAAVIETFEAAVSRHGRPEKAMSDGGSAFYAWRGVAQFTRLLEELEVDQLIAKKPQSNGKLENLNANLQKELFNVEKFFDLGEAQHRLRAWVSFFNFRRTHHALGGLLVPADRYFGRSDEVLAQLEAGHGVDGAVEPVPVGERLLDLLRVTSRAGQLEIWLMGQRLLATPSTK